MKDLALMGTIERAGREGEGYSLDREKETFPRSSRNLEVKRAMTGELLGMGLSEGAVARILHLQLSDEGEKSCISR